MIRFDKVAFSYQETCVLQDFSHDFEEGRYHVVMGPSGCGKTTIMRLLLGLETPSSGAITLEGHPRFSAVFQEDRLIPSLSVAGNIELPQRYRPGFDRASFHQGLSQALDEMGLRGLEHRLAKELSGGQARRVSILRALLTPFDVLILDEPLKGFDEAMRKQVIRFILNRTQGKTVFWITHYEQELDLLQDFDLLKLNCKQGR